MRSGLFRATTKVKAQEMDTNLKACSQTPLAQGNCILVVSNGIQLDRLPPWYYPIMAGKFGHWWTHSYHKPQVDFSAKIFQENPRASRVLKGTLLLSADWTSTASVVLYFALRVQVRLLSNTGTSRN